MADKPKKGTAVGNALRWLAKTGKVVAPGLLDAAGTITGIEGLDNLAELIRGDRDLTQEDKDMLLAQIEYDKTLEQEITKRWEVDLHSDSWLSKNIRPLTLSFLLFNMFVFIILDSSLKEFVVSDAWISLLSTLLATAIGGYFVIRGGEKIVNRIYKKK